GRKAHERARRGEDVEVPERDVTVYRFEQRWREADRAAFVIECSSGTYVRSLVADLGDAYCEELRRTRVGPFDGADADRAGRAGHGQTGAGEAPDGATGEVLLVDADGPVAIAVPRDGALLKPI